MRFKSTLRPASYLIDLTPLVDVVLLMLIFFMITSDVLPFKSIPINPPALELQSSELTTQLLVIMDAQNVIYLGSKKEIVDLESFGDSLQLEIQNILKIHPMANISIVLSIDRGVEYGDFLRLFAKAQQAGLQMRLMYNEVCSKLID
jgi:biopolymer transport protein ExbD